MPFPSGKSFGKTMSAADFSLLFLGTGTSVGVPVIGCACDVCRSRDPRDNRTRSSVLVSCGDTTLLIDSGPDLREQALREKITAIDAVLYTHSHLDHVVGFDELRAFCWGKDDPLPLYATADCLTVLKNMFGWAFHPDNTHRGYVKPDPRPVTSAFRIGGLAITPLPVEHGGVETVGYLFETDAGFRTAYLPDVKRIPAETMALMEQLDALVIDALRDASHSTHLCVDEALEISRALSPRRTLLTHISHDLGHAELSARLPDGVEVAYDGLKVSLA
jgi:phosphoribosyl 1,2-cyclic phosphate phosphodiesterase